MSRKPRDERAGYTFCPYDGSTLERVTEPDGRRLGRCRRCDFVDYGNPKPCVAVLLVSDRRLLLARRAVQPAVGEWDIPGGFIDTDETAEGCVVREMVEETGLTVRITGFLGSFPDTYGRRADPTLNLVFLAEPVAGTLAPRSDVAELQWFAASQLPRQMAFQHQYEVLQRWRETLPSG
jgi:NADH pyrophosphatase NudC (nudix superfamily)